MNTDRVKHLAQKFRALAALAERELTESGQLYATAPYHRWLLFSTMGDVFASAQVFNVTEHPTVIEQQLQFVHLCATRLAHEANMTLVRLT